MSDWKSSFRDYADHLEQAWPAERSNQVAKFNKFVDQACKVSGLTRSGVIDQIIAVAERRQSRPSDTIFLISCGSSGSHWLEAMLADFPRYVACGEVYLPRDLMKATNGWEQADRTAFLDCVHLAHVPMDKESLVDVRLINSAHLSGWILSRINGAPQRRVLLLRNPVDIVISRTYRKDDYRKFSGPGADDEQYLAKNIEFVNTFYRTAHERGAEIVLTYEQLRQQGPATMERLMQGLGDPKPAAECLAVAQKFSMDAQAAQRGARLSNYYRGPEIVLPDGIRERIAAQIDPAAASFGY